MAAATAKSVAASLQASAEQSRRRKGTAFQSAMSMLNFYNMEVKRWKKRTSWISSCGLAPAGSFAGRPARFAPRQGVGCARFAPPERWNDGRQGGHPEDGAAGHVCGGGQPHPDGLSSSEGVGGFRQPTLIRYGAAAGLPVCWVRHNLRCRGAPFHRTQGTQSRSLKIVRTAYPGNCGAGRRGG
jgi:hypothetical protein